MGIKQFQKLDEIVASRNEIREEYIKGLTPLGFEIQTITKNIVYNVQSLVFKVPINISRDDLIKYLKVNEIETTIGTYCLSGTTYYSNKYNDVQPNAMFLEKNTITFPCYDDVNVEYIVNKIKEY